MVHVGVGRKEEGCWRDVGISMVPPGVRSHLGLSQGSGTGDGGRDVW